MIVTGKIVIDSSQGERVCPATGEGRHRGNIGVSQGQKERMRLWQESLLWFLRERSGKAGRADRGLANLNHFVGSGA